MKFTITHPPTFYQKYRGPLLLLFLAAVPFVLYGSHMAQQASENRVQDFLPAHFEETKRFFWFADQFGSDELLMISWEGCALDDPRLEEFARRLEADLPLDQAKGTMAEARVSPTANGAGDADTGKPPPGTTDTEGDTAGDTAGDTDTSGNSEADDHAAADPGGESPGGESTEAADSTDSAVPPSTFRWFQAVYTAPRLLEKLTSADSPIQMSRPQALRRMEGWLVGPDRETACIVALVSPSGRADRDAAVAFVWQQANKVEGLSSADLYVAGSTIESVAINEAASQGMGPMTIGAILISIVIMFWAFRSVWLSLFVFITAGFSQELSTAIMYYSGARMDSMSLMVPTLVFVLGISAGVHVVNYYRAAVREDGIEGAAMRAVQHAWRPCLLASITTALGLISLAVSQLTPIRKFGIFAAIGVLVGLVIMFLILPCLLELLPPQRWAKKVPVQRSRLGSRWLWQMAALVINRYGWVLAATAVMMVAGGYGVSQLRSTARLHDLFLSEARVLRDYAWLEKNIGPLVPLEIVIRIPDDSKATPLEKVQVVTAVEMSARELDPIKRTISVSAFLPRLPSTRGGGIRQVVRRRMINRELENRRGMFEERGYVRVAEGEQLWRVTARLEASDPTLDYGEILDELQVKVDERLAAAQQRIPGIKAVVCGSIPLVHKTQDQLLADLMSSYLLAFTVIAAAMMLMLRSFLGGLISMVPNLLPSILVMGALGLGGTAIEVGSMMTASAALGIAVDDTLHFVTWFQSATHRGLSRQRAVRFAYSRCAKPVLQTSLICGLGLVIFAASPFAPIARFSWLMAAMLAAALFGDLVVLPGLLSSPLARWFTRSPDPPATIDEPASIEEPALAEVRNAE